MVSFSAVRNYAGAGREDIWVVDYIFGL